MVAIKRLILLLLLLLQSHGFFRGLGFPFVTYGLVNSIFFGVYGNTLKFLEASGNGKTKYFNVYLAGCIGGATQLVVACPVDVIKVILQAQLPNGKFFCFVFYVKFVFPSPV